jgi:two-component system chemotaxis response regulator CheB
MTRSCTNVSVLLIESHAAFRLTLATALRQRPGIEVVGTAGSCEAASALLKRCRPDVILLDDEVTERRELLGDLAIAVIPASGPLARPTGDRAAINAWVDSELIPHLRQICRSWTPPKIEKIEAPPPDERPPRVSPIVLGTVRPQVMAIASSTGGPEALPVVLSALPATLPIPVVLVQHMPASFTPLFASQLDRVCPLVVREAVDGAVLRPGTIWLASQGRHLEVHRQGDDLVLVTTDDPPEHGCKPAADPLFRSVAAAAPNGVVGCVLTGMGEDGGPGSVHIHRAGGVVIAQDEATSVVWGMPGAVVKAGVAHEVLPLEKIAPALCRLAGMRRWRAA